MTKHYLIRTTSSAGAPTTYSAPCGYCSDDPKEFTPITNPSTKGVTCNACLEKLGGSVVIVKENNL